MMGGNEERGTYKKKVLNITDSESPALTTFASGMSSIPLPQKLDPETFLTSLATNNSL